MTTGDKKQGLVNFPIQSPEYTNTKEGGLYVYLIVEKKEAENCTACCIDSEIRLELENLVGVDGQMVAGDEKTERRFFPKGSSWPLLCCLLLGSTNWSGEKVDPENVENEKPWNYEYWACHFDDLTEEGKALYESLKKLYVSDQIHLLTFLDT